jgi:hypothetical protein
MTGQTILQPAREPVVSLTRCVAVVDRALPPGFAANAVGVMALTLGATLPELAGEDLVDADGGSHPGLIPQGLTVLAAPGSELNQLRHQALAADLGVIGFPAQGQKTNNYDDVRSQIAQLQASEIRYVGLIIYGPRRAVSRVTGRLPLLR